MNKEERVKLVFETISKIVGFEIKPFKEFYVSGSGLKNVYFIDEFLYLHCKTLHGYFEVSEYSILPIFKGGYQLEEIKEPLTAKEERDFLRQFEFKELFISTNLYMYSEDNELITVIDLNNINLSFDGLKKYKKYSGKELGL